MKNRVVALLLCASFALSLAGCKDKTSEARQRGDRPNPNASVYEPPVEPTEPFDPVEKPAYDIASEFSRDENISEVSIMGDSHDYNKDAKIVELLDTGKNTIFSETSLNMALGLLYEGSDYEANEELAAYLKECYGGDEAFDITKRNNELMNAYYNNKEVAICLANSVWADDDIALTDEYIKNVLANYNAKAESLDFQDANSAGYINDWCSDNTNGKITKIISSDQLASNRNVLVNALYFNGSWDEEFEDWRIEKKNFTNANGTVSNVTMMGSLENAYYENEYATAFSKPYMDNGIQFIGILPKQEGEFDLTDLDLNSLMESKTYEYDVDIKLPKFTVEDENHLLDTLVSMGLPSITTGDGNFSRMCTDTDLQVSDVIQKTYVDVNEKGTEAAAVTAVVMEDSCAMEEPADTKHVYLDRAFAFMIYDSVNDEVLFIGKVNEL